MMSAMNSSIPDFWAVKAVEEQQQQEPSLQLTALKQEVKALAVPPAGQVSVAVEVYASLRHLSPAPGLVGHEVGGVVKAVGQGVTRVKAGDRVAAVLLDKGKVDGRDVLFGEKELVIVPAKMPLEEAALLMSEGVVAYSTVLKFCPPGTRVGILGLGELGNLLVHLCRHMDCQVTAIAADNWEQIPVAMCADLDKVVRASGCTQESFLDVVIDTQRSTHQYYHLIPFLRQGGTFVHLGQLLTQFCATRTAIWGEVALSASSVKGRRVVGPHQLRHGEEERLTVGGPALSQACLDLCATMQILPIARLVEPEELPEDCSQLKCAVLKVADQKKADQEEPSRA